MTPVASYLFLCPVYLRVRTPSTCSYNLLQCHTIPNTLNTLNTSRNTHNTLNNNRNTLNNNINLCWTLKSNHRQSLHRSLKCTSNRRQQRTLRLQPPHLKRGKVEPLQAQNSNNNNRNNNNNTNNKKRPPYPLRQGKAKLQQLRRERNPSRNLL